MRAGWRPRLVAALRDQPSPVLVAGDDVIPAASLWTGARRWVGAFRAAGLVPGDRVVLALPASAAFVQVIVAALWEGLALAPVPPGDPVPELVEQLDARLAVVDGSARSAGPGVWLADGSSGPAGDLAAPRTARIPPAPEVSLLLRTSGTTGGPRWVALSEQGVCSVLDSHMPALRSALTGACVVSVLPWHHAFGLVIDLLPALLAGAAIVRDPSGGRDGASLTALLTGLLAHGPVTLCAVPATVAALASTDEGRSALSGLAGGVVGGAPVTTELAAVLAGTALRSGYGQTEASPGIALGAPGRWRAGLLGRPVGCEVRLVGGVLEFRGENASLGTWEADGLRAADAGRWVATGDAVDLVDGELVHCGRTADHFKLANGRWVETTVLEPRLRAALVGAVGEPADAVLHTRDGSALEVLLVVPPGAAPVAREHLVRSALGPLGPALGAVRVIHPDAVVRDGKGALDRAATVGRVTA